MNNKYLDNEHLDYLLSKPSEKQNPQEDLMILQDDGSRACLNWELRGKGYHMAGNENSQEIKNYENMSDNELLKEAYKDLQDYRSRKENL